MGNVAKINRASLSQGTVQNSNTANRLELLADASDEILSAVLDTDKKKARPPPLYIREKNSNNLVNIIIDLIDKDSFHNFHLTKGDIHETKIQVKSEESFRKLTELLDAKKKNSYTFQLKSSKGQQVVIKEIEPDVSTAEVEQALKDKGLRYRNKQSQPLSKVELVPDYKTLKKNEVHSIYNLHFLLHRKISVEEPHKRNGRVQCVNCQEYGHTKSYCTLRSVCVACGGLHTSAKCKLKNEPNIKKCSKCRGDHTANYTGCPVYKELKNHINQRVSTAQSHHTQLIPNPHLKFSFRQ